MVVNISLECKSDSCKFSDRILSLEPSESVNIGRADTNNRTDCDNAYFNCKVTYNLKIFKGWSLRKGQISWLLIGQN